MKKDLKICVECKFHSKFPVEQLKSTDPEFVVVCDRNKEINTKLTTGETTEIGRVVAAFERTSRYLPWKCGRKGRFFQPLETLSNALN